MKELMVILTVAFTGYLCWNSYNKERTQYEEIILKLDNLQSYIQDRKECK